LLELAWPRIRSHQENALKQNLGLGSVSINTETLEHSSAACQPQENAPSQYVSRMLIA
jgi:hypothetical protein